ncbi:MAG: hypothetical protein RLZZ331_1734, partial [Pseudomonadota bacterium]
MLKVAGRALVSQRATIQRTIVTAVNTEVAMPID